MENRMPESIRLHIGGNQRHKYLIERALKYAENITITQSQDLDDIDILYWIYGRGPSWRHFKKFWISRRPLLIIHWIGTDVLELKEATRNPLIGIHNRFLNLLLKWRTLRGGILHLAAAPWLIEELHTAGFNARYLPLTNIETRELRNPHSLRGRDIDFLCYIPYNRFKFYGGDEIIQLANRLHDFSFLVIQPNSQNIKGDDLRGDSKNITFIPEVNFETMQELFLRSKCFIRLTDHDGLSKSVLEALYFRLQVIWTYPLPYVHCVEKNGDIDNLATRLQEMIINWQPNDQGHEYVLKNFSSNDWDSRLKELIYEVSKKRLVK